MKSSVRSEGAAQLSEIGTPQFYIADRLKVSKSIVGMWITGDRHPSQKNQEAIEAAYNIPRLNWLLLEKPRTRNETRQRHHYTRDDDGPVPLRLPASVPGESRTDIYRRVIAAGLAALLRQRKISTRRALEVGRMMIDLQKLEGDHVREIRVLEHPKWLELRSLLFGALKPFPEALRAVQEAIAAVEDEERVPVAMASAR